MAKNWAIIFGVVFVIVGLLGFVGGAGIVGANGVFVTDTVHDLVHLLSGLVILIVAFSAPQSSSSVLKVFGIVYLVVTLLGFFMTSPLLGIMAYNGADNWLHLVLGVVITWAGFGSGNRMASGMAA